MEAIFPVLSRNLFAINPLSGARLIQENWGGGEEKKNEKFILTIRTAVLAYERRFDSHRGGGRAAADGKISNRWPGPRSLPATVETVGENIAVAVNVGRRGQCSVYRYKLQFK